MVGRVTPCAPRTALIRTAGRGLTALPNPYTYTSTADTGRFILRTSPRGIPDLDFTAKLMITGKNFCWRQSKMLRLAKAR